MRRVPGFTLIELLVVLVIAAVTLTLVALTFNRYMEQTSARRAAEIFGQDLVVARSWAARSRQAVVLEFDEPVRRYVIRVEAGDTLRYRSYDGDSEVSLSSLDLQMPGDTVAFNSRGVADLSGAGGPLGRAVFTAGTRSYVVSFNSLGSSRVAGS